MRRAFLHELERLEHPGLTKQARGLIPSGLFARLMTAGGVVGATGHGLQSAESTAMDNPYLGPRRSLSSNIIRGIVEGAVAAAGLKGLGRLGAKKGL